MINLPQVIASFHSVVGLAALLVGVSNFYGPQFTAGTANLAHKVEVSDNVLVNYSILKFGNSCFKTCVQTYAGVFIAAVTLVGSGMLTSSF
jgi:NAD/NADP transhydrogenase beta subunit